jgi:hypothetical protein
LIISTALSIFAAKADDLNETEFVSRDVESPGKTRASSGGWTIGAMKRHAAFIAAARLAPG